AARGADASLGEVPPEADTLVGDGVCGAVVRGADEDAGAEVVPAPPDLDLAKLGAVCEGWVGLGQGEREATAGPVDVVEGVGDGSSEGGAVELALAGAVTAGGDEAEGALAGGGVVCPLAGA